MNFIKTSKFSVKGIDTTRYIPRALARGISAVKSKGLKDPLRTSPKRDLKFFGWSWRRGLYIGTPPFQLFPKNIIKSHSDECCLRRRISSFYIFGWSWRRGFIPPPLMETPHCVRGDRGWRVCRPVAKSARGD